MWFEIVLTDGDWFPASGRQSFYVQTYLENREGRGFLSDGWIDSCASSAAQNYSAPVTRCDSNHNVSNISNINNIDDIKRHQETSGDIINSQVHHRLKSLECWWLLIDNLYSYIIHVIKSCYISWTYRNGSYGLCLLDLVSWSCLDVFSLLLYFCLWCLYSFIYLYFLFSFTYSFIWFILLF